METLSSYLNAVDIISNYEPEYPCEASEYELNIANEFHCRVTGPMLMLDVYLAYAQFKGYRGVTNFRLMHEGQWLAYDQQVMDYALDGTEVIAVQF